MGEILGFMDQSNISQKNIARLKSFASIDDATFQKLRVLILEIAQLAPRRRGRWKLVASNRRDLLQAAIEAGLIEHFSESSEFEESDSFEFIQSQDSDEFESFDMNFSSRDPDDFDDELADSDVPL